MNYVQHADLDCPMIARVHGVYRRHSPGSMRKLTGVVVFDSQISKTCRVPSRRHPTLKVTLRRLMRIRMQYAVECMAFSSHRIAVADKGTSGLKGRVCCIGAELLLIGR